MKVRKALYGYRKQDFIDISRCSISSVRCLGYEYCLGRVLLPRLDHVTTGYILGRGTDIWPRSTRSSHYLS